MTLTDTFSRYLRAPNDSAAMIRALDQAELGLESKLLARHEALAAGSLLLPRSDSPFIGRRVWVGWQLPADAGGGDLWFDPLELSLMVLVPREPHVKDDPPDRYPPLLAWLSVRPVAAWQLGAASATSGGQHVAGPDETAPATRMTRGEALDYVGAFGKMLAGEGHWQAAQMHLSESALEAMWEGQVREWSATKSVVRDDLGLLVRADARTADVDEILNAEERPVEDVALPPDTRAPDVGFRTTVSMQFGLQSGRLARPPY